MQNLMQYAVAISLTVMLVALADLLPFWMPDMGEMLALTVASVLLIVWAGFVMFEKAVDEREVTHRMHAGRVAYLAGLAVLTLGLVVQGFAHAIDPWIAGALVTMVLSKLGARMWLERRG
jgi:hypothetical protein